MSIFYEGPNFFASGRIFWLIWPKSFAGSWQHWTPQMIMVRKAFSTEYTFWFNIAVQMLMPW
jgi:hypothetical protein